MVRHLWDWANAITVLGLIFTTCGLAMLVRGEFQLATVLLMWAVMLDHCDGYVARRLKGRRNQQAALVGADLDSLTDFASGIIAPAVLALLMNKGSLVSTVGAVVFVILGTLRVSCFNNFGYAPSGRFYGVPLTYNIPIIALLLALTPFIGVALAGTVLPLLLIALGVLHVVPFGPPPLSGWGYAFVFTYSIGLTIAWGMT